MQYPKMAQYVTNIGKLSMKGTAHVRPPLTVSAAKVM